MGSGKKKDKKKKKRQRSSSSSSEDSEEDYTEEALAYLEKYKHLIDGSSSRKGDSYIVEDVRPKQLQAIKDNYTYDKSEKKKKRSYKYHDVPETEEYIYDYSGQQIVQSSRNMSSSPEQSTDDDDEDQKYKSKSDKKKYTNEQPVIDLTTNYSKQKDEKKLKIQKKNLVDKSDNVSSNYPRKKDSKELTNYTSADYTRKKDTIDLIEQPDYSLADYTRKKDTIDFVEQSDYTTTDYTRKKETKDSGETSNSSPADYIRKKLIKESRKISDYSSADYTRQKETDDSGETSNSSPADYIRKKLIKESRELSDYSSADYTRKKETKDSGKTSNSSTADYIRKKLIKDSRELSDYSTTDYTRKKETKDLGETSNSSPADYIRKKLIKESREVSDYSSADYTRKTETTDLGETSNFSSADYIRKKLIKESRELSDYSTTDYTSKNEIKESRTLPNYTSADYSSKNEAKELRKLSDSREIPDYTIDLSEQSDYTTVDYTRKKESKEQPDNISSNYTSKRNLIAPTGYVTSDYSQKSNSRVKSDAVSMDYHDSQDYSSADYILKKIREQTKFIPSVDVKEEPQSDYAVSYAHKKESRLQPEYELGNYKEKSLNEPEYDVSNLNQRNASREQYDVSSEYKQKGYSRESSDYGISNAQPKSLKESTDYVSAEYAQNKKSTKPSFSSEYNEDGKRLSDYPLSDYVYKEDGSKPSDYPLPGYKYQKDTNNYYVSDHTQKKDTIKQPYVTSDYIHKNNSEKEVDYESNLSDYPQNKLPSTQFEIVSPDYPFKKDAPRENTQLFDGIIKKQGDYTSSDYEHKTNSSKQSDYTYSDSYQKEDPRYQSDYDSSDYNQKPDSVEDVSANKHVDKYSERSHSPLKREVNKEVMPHLFPPGTDWPLESSSATAEPSTSDDYYSWQPKNTDKETRQYEKQIEKDYPSKKIEDPKNEPPIAPSSNSDSSLSIEETNKLRAKLGLKPLKVGDGSASTTEEKNSYVDREDVHRPATNISDKKSEEKMREKMEAIREKRKINKKLQKVKGLGEEDDPVLDSAAAWVANSRIQEKEKAMAEKRAQMLEEMDEEFGVTKIMAKSILKKKSKYDQYGSRDLQGLGDEHRRSASKYDQYGSSDLQGLRVEHRGSEFAAGESVILTLKDKDVLDEDDEDVLQNINVRESEKTRLNIKNKSKKPGYQAYDEIDEETGEFKQRSVLDKYDEEIEGEKRDSFRIDAGGTADLNGENHINNVRALLKAQQVSLADQNLQLARDYYTNEEMVSFNKPRRKKVRKIRKREVLKADDLLKMDLDLQKNRKKLKSALKNSNKPLDGEAIQDDNMEMIPEGPDELDYFVAVNQHEGGEEEALPEENDKAEQELQLALERSRRAKLRNIQGIGDEDAVVEKVAREVLSKPQVKEEEVEVSSVKTKKKAKGAIVLDSTSEFCRTLGDIPTIVPSDVVEETEQKSDDDMDLGDEAATTVGGWEQVEMADQPKEEITVEEDDDVLEAEPTPTGVAATLLLANMKGYLKDGKEKVRRFDPLNLPETKAEVDIEKLRDEEKVKYARGYERDRERDRYDPYQFKEKTNYKPDIKLEYVDNKGRQMNQKEAFRLLSHKFHGKGSGKLKTEKRSKKLLDEKKLQMMSSIDTPLNTAALFKDKQKQSQSAYLVLSGGGKNILSGETLKK